MRLHPEASTACKRARALPQASCLCLLCLLLSFFFADYLPEKEVGIFRAAGSSHPLADRLLMGPFVSQIFMSPSFGVRFRFTWTTQRTKPHISPYITSVQLSPSWAPSASTTVDLPEPVHPKTPRIRTLELAPSPSCVVMVCAARRADDSPRIPRRSALLFPACGPRALDRDTGLRSVARWQAVRVRRMLGFKNHMNNSAKQSS